MGKGEWWVGKVCMSGEKVKGGWREVCVRHEKGEGDKEGQGVCERRRERKEMQGV